VLDFTGDGSNWAAQHQEGTTPSAEPRRAARTYIFLRASPGAPATSGTLVGEGLAGNQGGVFYAVLHGGFAFAT